MAELKTTADFRRKVRSMVNFHFIDGLIDDIDTLLAENQKMREALSEIADLYDASYAYEIAREALKTVNAERTDSDTQT